MKLALVFILSYLIGSIPFGVIVGKVFFKKDILKLGSGNIGTTNTFRVFGKKAGIVVLLLDMFKGTLGASLPIIFGYPQHWLILIVGMAAVLGHTKSIFINFKGGKAVATSVGVLLAYNPPFFVIAWAIFLTILFLSSRVSVASLSTMFLVTIISVFYHDWLLTAIALALTFYIFYRHQDNIKRIKNNTESMIPFGLTYWKTQKFNSTKKD